MQTSEVQAMVEKLRAELEDLQTDVEKTEWRVKSLRIRQVLKEMILKDDIRVEEILLVLQEMLAEDIHEI